MEKRMMESLEITFQEPEWKPVSPMMFGTNIEHTRSCIYQGLSAQMLRNRKFAGKPAATSGHAMEWYPIGEKALFVFDEPYTRHHELYHMKRSHERNAQRVVNIYPGQVCGIGQHELVVQAGQVYQFRMAVRTSAPVVITAALTSRFGRQVYTSCRLEAESDDWQVLQARLTCPATDEDADLRITFDQKAAVSIGAVSLMPSSHFHGMRTEAVACLKEAGIRLLRWPGGNFAGEYNWLDGLLPADMRAPFESCLGIETQPSSMGYDFHEINTDDFIALCREIGAEPFITINPCWNTPEESAAWVEYCNGDASTPYGRLRAERGYPEPYRVRLWSLGNEFGYGHMEGENTPEGYCRVARENAEKMLAVSPDLRLCSSGPYPDAEWAHRCAAALSDQAGLVSQHFYAHLPLYPDAEDFQREYENCIAGAEKLRSQIRQNRADLPEDVSISMDEWNVWYAWYRPSSVTDGIFTALTLHMLLAEAETLKIAQACHFEAVNEGLITVTPREAFLTAQGQVFALMKNHIGGHICHRSPRALATCQSGAVFITVVNPSYDQPQHVRIPGQGTLVRASLYSSETVIPPSRFTEQHVELEADENSRCFIMPPHSVLAVCLAE
ncbi:MAG: hypothetical protein IKU70_06100 [Clostridia bacterium]|nr:hypothetical protein [Clostridia bacterium]